MSEPTFDIEAMQASIQELSVTISQLESEETEAEQRKEIFLAEEERLRKLFEQIKAQRVALAEKAREARWEKDRLARKKSSVEYQLNTYLEQQKQLAEMEKLLAELDERMLRLIGNAAFWPKMRDFQKDDIRYVFAAMEKGLKGVLNANDMGLGKTFEATAVDSLFRAFHKEKTGKEAQVLWVTKKSLVNTTIREVRSWNPDRLLIPVAGDAATRKQLVSLARGMNAICITNYEALNTTSELTNNQWDLVIMDEVHKLKGGENVKTWHAAKQVVEPCRFYFPMSGSPIQNKPDEMWSYLHFLAPDRFPDSRRFSRAFGTWGSMRLAKIDEEKLIRAMSGQVIRRRRSEVEIQLPPIERIVRFVDLNTYPAQKEMYQQMKDQMLVWLDDNQDKFLTATAILAQLTRLRQIAVFPDPNTFGRISGAVKIDEAMDIIGEICSDPNEQIVVFSSQFNPPLEEIKRRCDEFYEISCEIVNGETTSDVDGIVNRFQQGKTQVLCVNAKAGGEGLNLQKSERWPGGASTMIFLDLWYNPKFNEQAEARVWRQGQTNHVVSYTLHAEGTVDEFILDKLQEKMDMINGLMEGDALRKSGKDWKEYLSGAI